MELKGRGNKQQEENSKKQNEKFSVVLDVWFFSTALGIRSRIQDEMCLCLYWMSKVAIHAQISADAGIPI